MTKPAKNLTDSWRERRVQELEMLIARAAFFVSFTKAEFNKRGDFDGIYKANCWSQDALLKAIREFPNFRRSSQNQTVTSGVEGAHQGTTADKYGSREPEKLNNAQKSCTFCRKPLVNPPPITITDDDGTWDFCDANCRDAEFDSLVGNRRLAESSLSAPPPESDLSAPTIPESTGLSIEQPEGRAAKEARAVIGRRDLSESTHELERLRELVKGLKEACETCLSGDPSDSLSPRYWLNRIKSLRPEDS